MTMTLAMASMPLSRPNPSRATDPATTDAPIATPPSTPIQARVSQDSSRARRASRIHSADTATCLMSSRRAAGGEGQGSGEVTASRCAPVPRSSFGPALNDRGCYVGRVERNLYWLTDGIYQSAFLTTRDGVVLFDAPRASATTYGGPWMRSPPPTA